MSLTLGEQTENSLVGIGDETGFVRLIESEKELNPGFNAIYLGIPCHDNAVFDISWSPDDHQLVRSILLRRENPDIDKPFDSSRPLLQEIKQLGSSTL